MNRHTLLWTVVVFFGASVAFSSINNATEGESTALRLGVQVVALAAIIALITLIVRLRDR